MNQNIFETSEENPVATQFKTMLLALERYATKAFKATDLSTSFIDMENPTVKKPVDLTGSPKAKEKKFFSLRLKKIIDQEDDLKVAIHALFSIIWGQCSKSMVTKFDAVKEMIYYKKKGDCASLLKEIKKVSIK